MLAPWWVWASPFSVMFMFHSFSFAVLPGMECVLSPTLPRAGISRIRFDGSILSALVRRHPGLRDTMPWCSAGVKRLCWKAGGRGWGG